MSYKYHENEKERERLSKDRREKERDSMSANLKDSNLQMLALSSGVFAHSQHESLVCGLPLHCLYITYYSTDLPHNLPNGLILGRVSANTRRCATPQEKNQESEPAFL